MKKIESKADLGEATIINFIRSFLISLVILKSNGFFYISMGNINFENLPIWICSSCISLMTYFNFLHILNAVCFSFEVMNGTDSSSKFFDKNWFRLNFLKKYHVIPQTEQEQFDCINEDYENWQHYTLFTLQVLGLLHLWIMFV